MSGESYTREISELRERVLRLEIQFAEMNKRLEALSNYARQLFDYLSKLSRE